MNKTNHSYVKGKSKSLAALVRVTTEWHIQVTIRQNRLCKPAYSRTLENVAWKSLIRAKCLFFYLFSVHSKVTAYHFLDLKRRRGSRGKIRSCDTGERRSKMTITLRCRFFLNIQLMRMVVFYVLLAAASETEIRFSSTRLGFAAHEVSIFRKQCKIKKSFSWNSG